jgi:hypothetical protein
LVISGRATINTQHTYSKVKSQFRPLILHRRKEARLLMRLQPIRESCSADNRRVCQQCADECEERPHRVRSWSAFVRCRLLIVVALLSRWVKLPAVDNVGGRFCRRRDAEMQGCREERRDAGTRE